MGIPGLTKFVKETFQGWEKCTLKGHLIIDGYGLCHQLYAFEWNRGGEYSQFREEVLKMFNTLLEANVRPIVIFDGIDYKKQKVATTMKRRRESIKHIHENISNPNQGGRTLSLLATEVFLFALREINVPFYVADGEADEIIVEIANYFGCPVLGLDSDFFMFNIVGGYIPIDRFDSGSKPVSCQVFHLSKFLEQFDIKHADLRFVVPAIIGNDFVSSVFSPKLAACMAHEVSVCSLHPVAQIMKCIYCYPSIEIFLFRMKDLSCYGQLKSNCCAVQAMYTCEKRTNPECLLSSSVLKTNCGKPLPNWIVRKYRQGDFPRHNMSALVIEQSLLRIVPDVSMKSTSMDASLSIRQKIYYLFDIPSVKEFVRIKLDLSARKVSSLSVSAFSPQLISPFPVEVFCKLLNCEYSMLQKVNTHWRFVVAVTKFWAETLHVPTFLVEALIFCNVLCFTCHATLKVHREKCASPLTFTRSKWMLALHAFSQWQCCYLDALSVNQLLIEPFEVLSPAFLYDGTIALQMAQNVSSAHSLFPIDIELYQSLLDVVLSHRYAETNSRLQAVHEGGSRCHAALPTQAVRKEQIKQHLVSSNVVHANPFSSLQIESDSDSS